VNFFFCFGRVQPAVVDDDHEAAELLNTSVYCPPPPSLPAKRAVTARGATLPPKKTFDGKSTDEGFERPGGTDDDVYAQELTEAHREPVGNAVVAFSVLVCRPQSTAMPVAPSAAAGLDFKRFRKAAFAGCGNVPQLVALRPDDGRMTAEAETWFAEFGAVEARRQATGALASDDFPAPKAAITALFVVVWGF
jgi:hypothetical protein